MTLIVEPNGPVSEEEINTTEDTLGVRLPEAYRNWMLRTGGGELSEDTVIPGTDDNGIITEIDGIDQVPSLQDLADIKRVPNDYLIIALGAGGVLTIRIAGADQGSVWWADYDKAQDLGIDHPSEEIMLRLADDFDSFLTEIG